MVLQTDSSNSHDATKKPEATQPKASQSHVDANALLADHKSIVAGAQRPSHGDANIANPKTADLFAAKNTKPSLFETNEPVAAGQTLEQIARRKLGPHISPDEFDRYVGLASQLNGVDSRQRLSGGTLDMPGRNNDGSLMYTNPRNSSENFVESRDGKLDIYNTTDGTHSHQEVLDEQGSYREHHNGPKKTDNYDRTYIYKDKLTYTDYTDNKGNTVRVGDNGAKKTTDRYGNWKATFAASSTSASASYDKASDTSTQLNRDGSTVVFNGKDKTSTISDTDGTKTVVDANGARTVEKKDGAGHSSGYKYEPVKDGGYTQLGWGPKPSGNYRETYNPKSGITTRVEAAGTPESKTTTRLPDGTIKVAAKNGENYQRNPDGSEHHWGKRNFDKPADDSKHSEAMNQARKGLEQSVKEHIPQKDQANFEQNMLAFEGRAQKEHLPPEEITKTYEQMNKLLSAKNAEAVVSGTDRVMLAEQLLRQTAFPEKTYQGMHNTCNVTAVAKETLEKNPSKTAEIVASTAIHGQYTAPDGKVIKVDRVSLIPGAEESDSRTLDGNRSYATQILNVVMANDALQRRNPPCSYLQRTPDRSTPGDTGERSFDGSGNLEKSPQQVDGQWISQPLNNPGLTDHELAMMGKRYNGENSRLIDPTSTEGNVEAPGSAQELGEMLKQFKDQRQFPVTLSVDGNHGPIQNWNNQATGFGGHFVSVTDYDAKHGRVKITNQWGSRFNGWVILKDLYANSSGTLASNLDGVDSDF